MASYPEGYWVTLAEDDERTTEVPVPFEVLEQALEVEKQTFSRALTTARHEVQLSLEGAS